ncbi:hypothetical protein L0F63_001460, partial [Massospora cicadina]
KIPPIAIGVSGGADSMLLAYLLSKVMDKAKLHGLVVDHALRPESAQEAELTLQRGKGLGFNCSLLTVRWDEGGAANYDLNANCSLRFGRMDYYAGKPLPSGSRLETVAREARYSAIAKAMGYTGSQILAMGHHGNDLIETFLFRFFRESGVAGLLGMSPLRPIPPKLLEGKDAAHSQALQRLKVFRPMLMVPKVRIYETCRHYGLEWVEDPTNSGTTAILQRSVIRGEIAKWEADTNPAIAQLKYRPLIDTVARYSEHNSIINETILKLLKDEVCFFPEYGTCQLRVPMQPTAPHWLTNPYLSARILSLLSRWVSCSSYPPSLTNVQAAYAAMLGLPSSIISPDNTNVFSVQMGTANLVSPSKKHPYWILCRSPLQKDQLKAQFVALDLLLPDPAPSSVAQTALPPVSGSLPPVKVAPTWKELWDDRFYLSISAKCDFRADKGLLLFTRLFLPGILALPLGDKLAQVLIRPLDQDLMTSLRNKSVVFGRKLPTPSGLKLHLPGKTLRSTVPVLVLRVHTALSNGFGASKLIDHSKHKYVDIPLAFPTLGNANIFPDLFHITSEPNFPQSPSCLSNKGFGF